VINSTVTGGSGVNAKAVLKTRMLGGDPPDSFQVHAGQELIGTWVVANRMDDLSDLFKSKGGRRCSRPASSPCSRAERDLERSGEHPPVERDLVRARNLKKWGVSPPKTLEDFLATCKTLQGKGVQHRSRSARTGPTTPLGVGRARRAGPDGWTRSGRASSSSTIRRP